MNKRLLAAVIFLLFVGVGGYIYGKGIPDLPVLRSAKSVEAEWKKEETFSQVEVVTTKEATLTVYVCGEVRNPGVYDLPLSGRLCDAVELAGGVTERAATSAVNMAEPLSDGERYYIPTRAESEEGVLYENKSDTRVNINTASKEELTSLPGIGQTRAESIVAYREANGKFESIEELNKVSGISEGIIAQIQDKIRIK